MEQLILALNAPQNQGKPTVINDLQRQIQRLQKEPAAWQTALELLDHQDPLLQFYGALTLRLKVDADWIHDQIGQDRHQLSQLIERLITSFVKLSDIPASGMVTTKLASTLAAICAKSNAAWAHPPRHVLSCILAGKYILERDVPTMDQILGSAMTVSGHVLKAVLRLSQTLQEELAPSNKSEVGHQAEVKLSNNTSDVWKLLQFVISVCASKYGYASASQQNIVVQLIADERTMSSLFADAVQQIPAWSRYINVDSPSTTAHVLFTDTLQLLLSLMGVPNHSTLCISCLAILQTECPRLLKQSIATYQAQIHNSSASQALMTSMLQGEFSSESASYLEYLEAVVAQFDCTTDAYLKNSDAVSALDRIQTLSQCPGAAMVEDDACQIVLEMLSTIVEGFREWTEPSPFTESMTTLVRKTCLATLVKVQVPEDELNQQSLTWDEDDFTIFEDYRFQAVDFFETAYGVLGSETVLIVVQALFQTPSPSWSQFDAVLFVFTSISDSLDESAESCDPALNQVLKLDLWQQATADCSGISGRIRWAVIRLISKFTSFLQRNPQHMISSLDFLFRSLHGKGYSSQAAKAIHELCQSQRDFLVDALPQFLHTLVTMNNITLYARHKVLSAVSALIQALPNEKARIEPLQQMLQLVQNLETLPPEDPSDSGDIVSPLAQRMTMLASIAKGLQSPSDTPIDLENITPDDNTFWTAGTGHSIQQAVLNLLTDVWNHLFDTTNADLVTHACEFLRAGFKEEAPSPLKFSTTISTQLLLALIDLRNPNLDQTMNTISCFLASSPRSESDLPAEVGILLGRVQGMAQECILMSQNNDTLLSAPSAIFDFVIRALPKYGTLILSQPTSIELMSTFIDYAIALVRGSTDTLPRRSATAFFTALIDITDPATKYMIDPAACATLKVLLDKYSPTILGLDIHFLAGECARSEIDTFTQLLKAFMSKQLMRAKRILQEAIKPENGVLTQKALEATKPEQRSRFISQLEALRGGRRTNDITKEFWLSCRGGQFGYVT